MSQDQPEPTRPRSVTSVWATATSAAVFIATVLVCHRLKLGPATLFFASLGTLFVVQATIDLAIRKVHLKPSTGLLFRADHLRRNLSIQRSLVKLFGLAATLAALAPFYLLIPNYSGSFHAPFWVVLRIVAPYVVALAIPYFILVDALMLEPRDGYWHMANLVVGRWREVDWKILREHAKGWVIKGFFLPLMTPYLISALAKFVAFPERWPIVAFVYYVTALALVLDLTFVVLGYATTLRVLDSHIRSANPYVYGWVACLVLYKPFWGVVGLSYSDGVYWFQWFQKSPFLTYGWAVLIVVAKLGWAWSNVMFGFRFSNLTHRGIITSGPYRITKHPSYVFKNIGWWLLNVPFLSAAGPLTALQISLALLCVNVLYYIRARSEEQHLSEDPDYVAYARWIDRHGWFRWFGKAFPVLSYEATRRAARRPEVVEASGP